MIYRIGMIILLFFLGILVAMEMGLSLHWPMGIDTCLLHYASDQMVTRGVMPYRDIFETSMPGTFLIHGLFIFLFGSGAGAFRIADLFFLGAMMAMTASLLRPFGRFASWFGALSFGAVYLGLGPDISLQRDMMGYGMVLTALWVAMRFPRLRGKWGGLICGLLVGMAATVKPHLAIGVIPLAWALFSGPWVKRGKSSVLWLFLAVGLALPWSLCLLWLWIGNALPRFLEMTGSYLPLHLTLNCWHEFMPASERWPWIGRQFLFVGCGKALTWWFGSLLSLGLLWLSSRTPGGSAGLAMRPLSASRRRSAQVLGLMMFCFWVYPVPAGKFWLYHWMPFIHSAITLAAVLIWYLQPYPGIRQSHWLRPLLLLLLVFMVREGNPISDEIKLQVERGSYPAPFNGTPDRVAEYLKENLRPGDLVQPLDWTRGTIHGMLLARANLATSFMYDYHFYHHAETPLIKSLRSRFLRQLREREPRFILRTTFDKPWVSGPGTTRDYPELEQFLQENYVPRLRALNLIILERRVQ